MFSWERQWTVGRIAGVLLQNVVWLSLILLQHWEPVICQHRKGALRSVKLHFPDSYTSSSLTYLPGYSVPNKHSCVTPWNSSGICMFIWDCSAANGTYVLGQSNGQCSHGTSSENGLIRCCLWFSKTSDSTTATSSHQPLKLNQSANAWDTAESTTDIDKGVSDSQTNTFENHGQIENSDSVLTTEISTTSQQQIVKQNTTNETPEVFELHKDCGIAPLAVQLRIVGGQEAEFGHWPWQVSVRVTGRFSHTSRHRNGGAILDPNWVLTAAHTVARIPVKLLSIRAGEYNMAAKDEQFPHQERKVKQVIIHPDFDPMNYLNDLALLQVESPFELQPHIRPICLPTKSSRQTIDRMSYEGTMGYISGWGKTRELGKHSNILREAMVRIISNSECEMMFLRGGYVEVIPDEFLCVVGRPEETPDACQGDSGGPLVALDKTGSRWQLLGVISWGIGCGRPLLPGVLVNVSTYTDWIMHVTKLYMLVY